jgi:hypothetical protein
MQMSTITMTKFLALMPLVVLGAACSGSSPVAPSNPLATDEGSTSAPNMSATSKDLVPSECRDITGVNLEIMPSTSQAIVIQASYVRLGGTTRCAAPIWTSNPRGALTPQLSAFRTGVSSMRPVTVTAMAPNGVKGSLTLGGKSADLNTSTTLCQGVTGVQLTVVPSTTNASVVVEATYLGFGPSLNNCPAPAWTSNPRGVLTPQLNAFRVGVNSPKRGAIVTATTRNGMRGQIRLQRS